MYEWEVLKIASYHSGICVSINICVLPFWLTLVKRIKNQKKNPEFLYVTKRQCARFKCGCV